MPKVKEDATRENRISDEVIVDCRPEEMAMGWYYYLDDKVSFPFEARVRKNRSISPVKKGEKVIVIGLEIEDECESEMWVKIKHSNLELSIPLEIVSPFDTDEETIEAVLDWHYWIDQGYCLQ